MGAGRSSRKHSLALMSTIRSIATAVCFSSILAGANAQVYSPLFTNTLRTTDVSAQNAYLQHAEHRMRIAELQAGAWVGALHAGLPLTFQLFDDVQYSTRLERDLRAEYQGVQVWKGRVPDARFDHLPHYRNTLLVYDPRSEALVLNIETEKGFFQVLPTATAGAYRVRDCMPFTGATCGEPVPGTLYHPQQSGLRANCIGDCDEVDADGRFVVDVFAGYSNSAATAAGALVPHALANIETVNMGLANSNVGSIYLRLVGTAVNPNNPGIITSVLDDAWTWFADGIRATEPDLLALFQTPTNAPGGAGGWGSMPGRSSVNGVEWPTVFRHEVGHNMGGNHCFPDNDNHRNGYDNGNWRTHLCGNDVNFYSSPVILDDQGAAIGHVDEADMARTWREQGATMARYALHRVPYHDADSCIGATCLPEHIENLIEFITRVQLHTLDNPQPSPQPTCDDVVGYSDFTAMGTTLERGSTYMLQVAASSSWEDSYVRVWIDWNDDGYLDNDERVADLRGVSPWTAPITVPQHATLDEALRMRVRLLYGSGANTGACNGSGYNGGETEDYTVHVTEGSTGIAMQGTRNRSSLFPNPAGRTATLVGLPTHAGRVEIELFDAAGRSMPGSHQVVPASAETMVLDLAGLPAGVHVCVLRMADGGSERIRFVKLP